MPERYDWTKRAVRSRTPLARASTRRASASAAGLGDAVVPATAASRLPVSPRAIEISTERYDTTPQVEQPSPPETSRPRRLRWREALVLASVLALAAVLRFG